MNFQRGIAPIVIILIIVAVLGMGGGAFVFLQKSEPQTGQTPLTGQDQDSSQLSGLWKVEKVFVLSSKTGEWNEAPVPFSLYTEFKDGLICLNWAIEQDQAQCKEYNAYTIQGNILTAKEIEYQWQIKDGKLELIQLIGGKPETKTISAKAQKAEFKFESQRAPTPQKTSLDQKLLIGLWKLDKVLGYNPKEDVWQENPTTAATYQEFTAKNMCLTYSTPISGEEPEAARFKCLGEAPYIVSGDLISFQAWGFSGSEETAYYRWNIVDSKLELGVGISDTPFLKYIYTKLPQVSWSKDPIALQFADTGSVKRGESFKIKGIRKTTETINVWLTDSAGTIIPMEIGSFWCSSLSVKSDFCIAQMGERMSFSPKPDYSQCPFSEIPWGSHPEIGEAVCFVPPVDGKFETELLIKKPGTYILHAKSIQSGVEGKLIITVP